MESIKQSLKPVRALYGGTPAAEFGPKALKAVRAAMVEAGLCRKEVNKRVGRVKRMFRWGVAEELLPPDVRHALDAVEGLKRGRTTARETEPVRPAPDADVEAALTHLPAPVAAMVRLQRLTGMRPGETVQLRPRNVICEGDVWEYRPRQHKTLHHGKTRTVMIGPRGQAVLAPYLERPAGKPCFSPREAVAEVRGRRRALRSTPDSCGNRPGTNRKGCPEKAPGEAYTTATYRQAVYRACDAAGVPRWSPNQLRHSLGTQVRRTHGLEASQVTLGHSRADVTQIYAERDAALARRAMLEVG
ncbi:tyrosine-type recombinase/integrase [Alienimonas sp. DA493]|uniref:tyrosine-type recombinase/integrase n=1 Tax=Alienimonas sp. DA493 TaxID=3373605 RepID=UPI0037541818